MEAKHIKNLEKYKEKLMFKGYAPNTIKVYSYYHQINYY